MKKHGAIHVIAKMTKNAVSSAAEAEIAGIFTNAKEAVPMKLTLEKMGHPQPPTEITTDDMTASGTLNKTFKAIDMNCHWVRDRIAQKQFKPKWERGIDDLADHFTKHHSPAHHKK